MNTIIKPTLVIALTAIFTLPAQADVITMIHESSGTGRIGNLSFTDANFTITATGNTEDRDTAFGAFFIDHTLATINIAGIGSFDFTTQTRTFVNNGNEIVGFSRSSPFIDLLNGPSNIAYATWDMTTNIGPHSGSGNLLQWNFDDVITTGGILFFESAFTDVQFTATVVPTPAALSLLTITGLAATRRRRI